MSQEVLVVCGPQQADAAGYEQLRATLAKFPNIVKAVAMPDLHAGPGIPIGACFVARGEIYPGLIGTDIGCGMTLFATHIKDAKRASQKLATRLTACREELSQPFQGVQDLLVANGLPLTDFDAQLGTLGGGNHFAEFLRVDKILNKPLFLAQHLCEDHLMLLVHSGSRALGRHIASQHAEVLTTPEQQAAYLRDHDMAVEWALANRMLVAHRIMDAVASSEGVKVLNIVHNYLQVDTNEDAQTQSLPELKHFLHRKGVGCVAPGQVTIIPGSRGTCSYLVKMCDDVPLANRHLCSVAHGAGRKWCRSKAAAHFANVPAQKLRTTAVGSSVVCSDTDLLREEHSDAYKDVTGVVDDLVAAGLVTIVARLEPVCTFKN